VLKRPSRRIARGYFGNSTRIRSSPGSFRSSRGGRWVSRPRRSIFSSAGREQYGGTPIRLRELARFYGEGHIVSETDIDEYICHSREETVFSLFGKIMERDLAASLEILQKLMLSADSSAVQILSGILWQLRRLILVKTSCLGITAFRRPARRQMSGASGSRGIRGRNEELHRSRTPPHTEPGRRLRHRAQKHAGGFSVDPASALPLSGPVD
jgi:hypothetical protein